VLATLILVFAPISFAYNGWLSNAGPSLKNDFTSYYVAGLAVRHGQPEALYYPEPVGSLLAQASEQHPWIDLARPAGIQDPNYYLYPPLFAVLFAPMTLLPYKAAYLLWAAMGGAYLAASVALILTTFEGGILGVWKRPRGMLAASSVILIACFFYPVARNFAVGQSSLFLLLLMAAALAALRRRTRAGDAWAGLCLAAGILLKLTPLILIPWLALRRRWRALELTLASAALLVGISIAAVGLEPHVTYVSRMLPQLSGGTAFYPNQSITGVAERLFGGAFRKADLVDPAGTAPRLARWLGSLLILVTLAQVARMRTGGATDPQTDDRAFGLLLLAGLAASPISWEHHYVLALIPAWVLVRDAAEKGWITTQRALLAGTGLALAGSYVGLRVIGALGDGAPARLISASGLAGGLILWWVLMRTPRNPAHALQHQRAAAPAALLTLIAVFAAGNFLLKVVEYSRAYGYGDFTSYYVAAATLREGRGDPLYYPATPDMILARAVTPSAWTETAARWGVPEANYYLYPPFFAMAMTPLTLVSYGSAHALWYIANLVALGASAWLYARSRLLGGGQVSCAEMALIVMALALSWPSLFTFGAGQANFVVLLLLVGALAALRSGSDAGAGLMTAGAVAIKMTPALLLVYLAWRRRWKALGWAAAGLGALVVAGAAAAGGESYAVYVGEMVPALSRGCAHWINESPAAFFTRLIDGGDLFSWALATPSGASRILTGAAGLALAAGAFLAIGWGRRMMDVDMEFSLMVVTTLFLSPLSWTHHSVLSILAFLLATRWLMARSLVTPAAAAALAITYTLIHVHVKPPGFFEQGPLRLLASYNLAGNLALWGLLVLILRRARRQPVAAPS
jgi:hypothetical protein